MLFHTLVHEVTNNSSFIIVDADYLTDDPATERQMAM
jgi:hypothetical protein